LKELNTKGNLSATRMVASTFGVLLGFFGMEHGLFEILQGNIAPNDILIHAIGPEQRFWEHGLELALTIIPNFLLTGILAIIVGLFIIIWAYAFIDRKYGAWILMLLSIMLLLTGGGIAPVFLAVFASTTAGRINKPLIWWHKHLTINLCNLFSRLWPWSLVSFVLLSLIMLEIAIFGYPLMWLFDSSTTHNLLWIISYLFLLFIPFTILTAFAYDIRKKANSEGGINV